MSKPYAIPGRRGEREVRASKPEAKSASYLLLEHNYSSCMNRSLAAALSGVPTLPLTVRSDYIQ